MATASTSKVVTSFLLLSFGFLLTGFCLALFVRWNMASTVELPPLINFEYNEIAVHHAVVMIHFGLLPILIGALGVFFSDYRNENLITIEYLPFSFTVSGLLYFFGLFLRILFRQLESYYSDILILCGLILCIVTFAFLSFNSIADRAKNLKSSNWYNLSFLVLHITYLIFFIKLSPQLIASLAFVAKNGATHINWTTPLNIMEGYFQFGILLPLIGVSHWVLTDDREEIKYQASKLFTVLGASLITAGILTLTIRVFINLLFIEAFHLNFPQHYLIASGCLLLLIGASYKLFSKIVEVGLEPALGLLHFWLTLICTASTVIPLVLGGNFESSQNLLLWSSIAMFLSQLVFPYNIIVSYLRSKDRPEGTL